MQHQKPTPTRYLLQQFRDELALNADDQFDVFRPDHFLGSITSENPGNNFVLSFDP